LVLRYDTPPTSFPLRQGEILCSMSEVVPDVSDMQGLLSDAESVPVYRVPYAFAIIISQDCDLIWDWNGRGDTVGDGSKLLAHIRFCELFEESAIHVPREFGSRDWRRIKQNQDIRYHHLHKGPIGESKGGELQDLYADFKRTFSLPVDYTYQLLSADNSIRRTILVDPFLRDFIHRLHHFLSRVPLPEENEVPKV